MKPSALIAVEQRLWQGIFRIAQDQTDVVTEMQAFSVWLASCQAELLGSVSRDWFKPEPKLNNTSRTFDSTDVKYLLLADIEGRFPQSWARPEQLTLPTSTSDSQPPSDLSVVPQGFARTILPSLSIQRLPSSPLSSPPHSPTVSDFNVPLPTPSVPDIDDGHRAGPTDEDIHMGSPSGINGPRGSDDGPRGSDDEPSGHEMDEDPGYRIKLRRKKNSPSPLNSPSPSKPVDMTKGLRQYAKKNTATKTSRHSVLDGSTADRAIDVDSIFVCNFMLHWCLCSLIY